MLNRLIKDIENGEDFTFFHFWGHTQKKENIIDKSCLSQWYPVEFTIDGILYKSAEHYMMAEKARLFNDEESLSKILLSKTPKEAKSLGRKVKNFSDDFWNEKSDEIVLIGNLHKFNQNPELIHFLLSIKEDIIVEASPYDKIWGNGLSQSSPFANIPKKWNGKNKLGFVLVRLRRLYSSFGDVFQNHFSSERLLLKFFEKNKKLLD